MNVERTPAHMEKTTKSEMGCFVLLLMICTAMDTSINGGLFTTTQQLDRGGGRGILRQENTAHPGPAWDEEREIAQTEAERTGRSRSPDLTTRPFIAPRRDLFTTTEQLHRRKDRGRMILRHRNTTKQPSRTHPRPAWVEQWVEQPKMTLRQNERDDLDYLTSRADLPLPSMEASSPPPNSSTEVGDVRSCAKKTRLIQDLRGMKSGK